MKLQRIAPIFLCFTAFACLEFSLTRSPLALAAETKDTRIHRYRETSHPLQRWNDYSRTDDTVGPTSPILSIVKVRGGGPSSSSRAATSISSKSFHRSGLSSLPSMSSRSSGWKVPFLGSIFGKKSTAQIYRESLEEQVLLLDRQLRQAHNEVTQLREQQQALKEKQRKGYAALASTRKRQQSQEEFQQQRVELDAERQTVREQQQQIQQAQAEILQLQQIKGELERLLETATVKIAELETKLFEQEEMTQRMKESHEQQLKALQEHLERRQQAQLEKLESMYKKRIEQAIQQAIQEQEAMLQRRLAELTEELQAKHYQELQEEQRRSASSMEEERKKMRKLVQALALREKKLLAKQGKKVPSEDMSAASIGSSYSHLSSSPSPGRNKPLSVPGRPRL